MRWTELTLMPTIRRSPALCLGRLLQSPAEGLDSTQKPTLPLVLPDEREPENAALAQSAYFGGKKDIEARQCKACHCATNRRQKSGLFREITPCHAMGSYVAICLTMFRKMRDTLLPHPFSSRLPQNVIDPTEKTRPPSGNSK